MYYSTEIQITPLTNVRRERVLPAPGDILVRSGDRVEPSQVVAVANLPSDFRLLPVARALGVPSAKVKRYMQVALGDDVHQGQVIAKRGRLISQTVKSPINGQVAASSSGGRVLIKASPSQFELHAYIPGTVTNVVEPHGVVVETTGAVIQGVWGAGGEGLGVLKCVVENPDEPLLAQAIDPSCHGVILVGGSGMERDALELALEFNVRGIVVGGLQPEHISQIAQSPLPVVVTEGIGTLPMSKPAFDLLTTNDGREAVLSGRVQSRWGVIRPEVVIPLSAERLPPSQVQIGMPLTVGARVRVIRAPYMSAVGTVAALPKHAQPIETGAKVYGAQIDLGQEEPVFIPLANLEILR